MTARRSTSRSDRPMDEPIESQCPYCAAPLQKKPKRKASCRVCHNPIYVRTLLGDRRRHLLTETRAREAQEEWERYSDAERCLRNLNVSNKERVRLEHQLTRELGCHPSSEEVFWLAADKRLHLVLARNDLHEAGMVYFQIALLLHSVKLPHVAAFQEAQRCFLRRDLAGGLREIEISVCPDSCPACARMKNARFSTEEALRLSPLPVRGCTHLKVDGRQDGWCRCCYVPVVHFEY